MAKVALVTYDVQTLKDGRAGGVAAFTTRFARLLRMAGEDVTIIVTRGEPHPVPLDERWRGRYADWGIALIEVHNTEPSADRWCAPWTARLSEQVASHLDGFDIAYFQDWANVAFCTARIKRFSKSPMPILVTVLHGPSGWERVGNKRFSEIPEDLHLDYIERYSARHSDFVVSPSHYMVHWARENGWTFGSDPLVLGLPHLARGRQARPLSPRAIRRIVYFGRLETRKGFLLFVAALRLAFQLDPAALAGLTEIVFLGKEQEAGSVKRVRQELADLNIPIVHMGSLDSEEAGDYLAEHAYGSLAIVPSPTENFPYAVIEASLIPGLNLLCSQGGGIPEIFDGHGKDCLFEPYTLGLADKMLERLRAPLSAEEQPAYDAEAANARWLNFHQRALARPASLEVRHSPATVDICVPYFNKPAYLPQLLTALERQTRQQFGVIVVNDGSAPEAKTVFDLLAEKYRGRGWTFLTQVNSFVDAARNRAAGLSQADYLLFIDADDIPAPNAVERMLESISLSADDCLVVGGMQFEDERLPYNIESGKVTSPILTRYMPVGPDLVCGLVHPDVLGASMILVRRTAFEAVGGYRTVRGVAHEDWELQIRLVMAGFRVDVLPEYLLYFRKTEAGLSRTSSGYEAKLRLIETYEDALAKVGLRGIAATVVALMNRREELEAAIKENEESRARRLHGLVGEMLRAKGRSS
jgi:glycosyltransferase involved in cell wall biosynthesis/GT2 family glycosyltransferase